MPPRQTDGRTDRQTPTPTKSSTVTEVRLAENVSKVWIVDGFASFVMLFYVDAQCSLNRR